MSTYPTSPRASFLQWCQAHESVFTDQAAAIGLSPAQATAFGSAAEELAAAMIASESAKQAARVAVRAADNAYDRARALAGDDVRLIRAFAEMQTHPAGVYALAQIAPPASRSPAPPPAQPTRLTAALNAASGALTLRWKAANPGSGTTYIIKRRLVSAATLQPGDDEWTFIGVSGKKSFVDTTLMPGPESVQYTVQGQRADSSGPVSAIFTVNFGQLSGGARTATVNTAGGPAAMSDKAVLDAIIDSRSRGNGQAVRDRTRRP